MKNILVVFALTLPTLTFARPVNPLQPNFNHLVCLSDYLSNSVAKRLSAASKSEALSLLEKIKQDESFQKEKLSTLSGAERQYLLKLSQDSKNLDQELDLAGSCEDMNAILFYIIQTLK